MENSHALNVFKFLLSTLLFIVLLVPLLFIFLIFIIYRTLVLIILKLKFGSQFGEILTGSDAFFANDGNSGCVINIIVVIKTRNSFQELFRKFKEEAKKKIFENPEQLPKFLARRHKICGYHYFVKNQIKIDDCIRSLNLNSIEEGISKDELLKEFSKYSNKTLPYNNSGFWEFLLCEKPVRWHNRTDKSEKSYVILLRFHHSLADGINLLKFMTNTFSLSNKVKKIQTPAQNHLGVKIRDILSFIYIVLIAPIVILSQKLFWHVESSSVDVPSLSGEQIWVVRTEESRECLKIIKGIKKKVEHTGFVEVVLAAISKSLSNYFWKKGKDPNLTNFGSYLTVLTRKSHLQLTGSKICNNFSYVNLKIPIIYSSNLQFYNYWESFMETLAKVKIETKRLHSSLDYKVNYGITEIATALFPESIITLLLTPPYLPLVITNLPGPSATTFLDDCHIDDIMFWMPCLEPIGITLGIFSYDERLQISLNVDKSIISNEEDAQDIVDGICQALIQLDSKI